ncbi:hypothetical protein CK203_028843 [Vitis vinifera]|uniref:Xylanase inhibitor C-terminal domain-containing protein n=1 Tax=Vitis vinifera TaxID=29760 RepID=A0A438IAH7_VITVI|nr:hypothetical protein CK203_028843 [Vitis vinifera]
MVQAKKLRFYVKELQSSNSSAQNMVYATHSLLPVFPMAKQKQTRQTTYVEGKKGLWCLAMLSSNSLWKVSILGNIQQQNYYVGYDLEAQVVSFSPVDCANF